MVEQPESDSAATLPPPSIPGVEQVLRMSAGKRMERYYQLIRMIPDVVFYLDKNGQILWIQDASGILGNPEEEMLGRSFFNFVHPRDVKTARKTFEDAVDARKPSIRRHQIRILTTNQTVRWIEITSLTHFDDAGRFIAEEGICRDITAYVETRTVLMTVHAELEEKVKVRTRALTLAKEELEREIAERTITEEMLREREIDLENEKINLQRANTALKVLLKRRTDDRTRIEKEVLHNIKKLVMPYLRKIKSAGLSNRQRSYLDILESNMDELPLAFSRKLSLKHYNLTPAEIRVANLIKKGKTTREIARSLNLSKRTIDNHRQNIRRKLRIRNKRVNLRTYLLSIT